MNIDVHTIDIMVVGSDDATIASLTSSAIEGVDFDGTAKRQPGDTRNPELGAKIAVARALDAFLNNLHDEIGELLSDEAGPARFVSSRHATLIGAVNDLIDGDDDEYPPNDEDVVAGLIKLRDRDLL